LEQGRTELGSTRLLGLPGLAVRRVELAVDGARVVHVQTADEGAAACPTCGFVSRSVKENVTTRPKDIPYGPDPVRLVWHKRRWRCRRIDCPRQTFTETIDQVPAGMRTTGRLRTALGDAVAVNRTVSEAAAAHGVSWPTAQRAVDERAAEVLAEPVPVRLLGIDETRYGAPRWVRDPGTGRWVRSDPWETGFVDLTGRQGLLGQADGRTGRTVIDWLAARDQAFRDTVQIVAVDPSAPYAAAVRHALPHARVTVDHFHLVLLANQAVTAVRQRVTREYTGRRGRRIDPVWVNRRLLLRAGECLSAPAFRRMWNSCLDTDPTGEILSAWIAKEQLRTLLGCAARGGHRHEISAALYDFYAWCADADIDELTTLARTVEAWWPAVLVFLQTGVTNATTEGTNRLVKQVKRTACGFRNRTNYRTRVRLHCTRNGVTARTRQPAQS
jgi:transposase